MYTFSDSKIININGAKSFRIKSLSGKYCIVMIDSLDKEVKIGEYKTEDSAKYAISKLCDELSAYRVPTDDDYFEFINGTRSEKPQKSDKDIETFFSNFGK